MSKVLLRLLIDIDISGFSRIFIDSPLKNQENSSGLSPVDTAQVADIDSPELTGLSLNENGVICGATIIINKFFGKSDILNIKNNFYIFQIIISQEQGWMKDKDEDPAMRYCCMMN